MSKRANAVSAEPTRWNLSVSRETDFALRAWLAGKGAKRGDLSRFVEDAVNRQVLREMTNEIYNRNADLNPSEAEWLVESELQEVRATFWSERNH